MPSFALESYLQEKRGLLDEALRRVFKSRGDCPALLWKSMKYSVFAGGKRLRPVLCLASAEAVGLPRVPALRLACALELLHTYSLIHDDLPALDDDDTRRGKKTNHVMFGEAMALLAGDGLQTLAFELASNPGGISPGLRKNIPAVVHELALFAGLRGMVGGQADDVLSEKKKPRLSKVLSIHRRKTGALILASCRLPALMAGASPARLEALSRYGKTAGLAFQIVDDILNETGQSRKLGKPAGSDRVLGKMTFPAAAGLARSRAEVERLTRESVAALGIFGGRARPLADLARYMAGRTA